MNNHWHVTVIKFETEHYYSYIVISISFADHIFCTCLTDDMKEYKHIAAETKDSWAFLGGD